MNPQARQQELRQIRMQKDGVKVERKRHEAAWKERSDETEAG